MALEPARKVAARPPLGVPEAPADDRDAALARLPRLPPPREGWHRAFFAEGQRAVREAHRAGASGRTVLRMQTALVDRLIQGLAAQLSLPSEGIALVAQGGYGRKELSPASDIDLLVLTDGAVPEIEKLLYPLWDLKLEVGHAVRRPDDSLGLARADPVTLTTLLDARLLAGDAGTFSQLTLGLDELLRRHGEAYIVEKRAELLARRQKFGESVYLLEPNVKQCEGGLRDLQTAVWIARVKYRVRGLRQLLASSILPPSTVAEAMRARDLLWRIRNELHLLAGRKEDRLAFDRRAPLAEFLGYRDLPEGLAVEQLMRRYYLAAAAIRRVADEIIERCAEPAGRRVAEEPVDAEFKLWGGQLTVTRGSLFADDPGAIARAFLASAKLGVPLYSYARDAIARELHRVDGRVRADPRTAATLRELFALPDTDGAWLAPMHEAGVLGAFLPELERVRALAQHDLYHVYTVDVHLLRSLRRLYALRRGDLVDEQPELTVLCLQVSAWLPLCLGVLFHDVGKGQGGEHSRRGAELTRQAAARLGLAEPDIALAEFLVAEHLTLSHVAQRRDLADPELIRSFAAQMGSAERLDLLYLLTYADVSSVGSGTWTAWKAQLFRELYVKARALLAAGASEAKPPADRRFRRAFREAGLGHAEIEAFLGRLPARYLRSVRPADALRHLRLLRSLKPALPFVGRRVVKGATTELWLCARDRPGLLALFAGALAAHRISILSAEVYSTATGEALDVFHVQADGGGPVEPARWAAARADLARVLAAEESAQALLARKVRPSKLLKTALPAVETRVRADNEAASGATVLDVTAEDRLGLLFTLAKTLHELGLEIALAKVTTEANRAVDAFYVTRDGRKIEDPATLLRIERALTSALAAGS